MPEFIAGTDKAGPTDQVLSTDSELRPTTAALLAYLEQRVGATVGKAELMDALWPNTNVTENSLYQAVSDLRRILSDHPELELKTVPRRGYRLVRRRRPPQTAQGGTAAPASARRRGLRIVAAAAVVMVLLAGVTFALVRPGANAVSVPPSIAVIPFEAIDDDPKWTRLGAGLSAEIAGSLARNSWLSVTAPASAEAARDLPQGQVGQHLGVRFVLGGQVQAEGDLLRVHATLRDDATARILWTERWERPADRLFDIQDDIIAAIDAQVGSIYSGTLADYGRLRAHRRATSDLDAFDNFLLGSEEKHKFTDEAYDRALVYLGRAVDLDPNYAQAWITLALTLGFKADIAAPEVAARLRARQLATAQRAYALDPDDPTVNWGMALTLAVQGERARAARHLRRALELAPNDADVLLIAGWIAPSAGIFGPEPLEWAERSAVLNPSAPAWHAIGHGAAAFASGDPGRSLEVLADAPDSVETRFYRAVALSRLGRTEEAQHARDALMTLAPDFSVEGLHGPIPPGSEDMMAALTEPARVLGIPVRLRP